MSYCKQLAAVVVLTVAGAAAAAPGRVENSSITIRLDQSEFRTVAGGAGASLLARGFTADVGGGNLEIGNMDACDGRISGVHVNIRASGSKTIAMGATRIGNVTAGCKR